MHAAAQSTMVSNGLRVVRDRRSGLTCVRVGSTIYPIGYSNMPVEQHTLAVSLSKALQLSLMTGGGIRGSGRGVSWSCSLQVWWVHGPSSSITGPGRRGIISSGSVCPWVWCAWG